MVSNGFEWMFFRVFFMDFLMDNFYGSICGFFQSCSDGGTAEPLEIRTDFHKLSSLATGGLLARC